MKTLIVSSCLTHSQCLVITHQMYISMMVRTEGLDVLLSLGYQVPIHPFSKSLQLVLILDSVSLFHYQGQYIATHLQLLLFSLGNTATVVILGAYYQERTEHQRWQVHSYEHSAKVKLSILQINTLKSTNNKMQRKTFYLCCLTY